MKLKKITMLLLSSFLFFATATSNIIASESDDNPDENPTATWTDEPSERAIELMEEARQNPVYEYPEAASEIVDGYLREYGSMKFTTSEIKNTYNFIGQASYHNGSTKPEVLQYMQGSTTTTTWNVSGTIEGSADIKLAFLSEIKAKLGVTVGRSTTTTKSSQALATLTVDPGYTGYIDAYHKAVYAVGSIPYWDYAPGTVSVERSGSINVSGYAIVQNSIHFDSYEKKD